MPKVGGYLYGFGPEGIIDERDSFTCGHCSRVSFLKPRQRPEDMGALCKRCMSFICETCAARRQCRTIEEWLQMEEGAIAHAMRRNGLA